jgi:hypothetical protein
MLSDSLVGRIVSAGPYTGQIMTVVADNTDSGWILFIWLKDKYSNQLVRVSTESHEIVFDS